MGVVRDVTIDQLTQAVQGISSAGMTDSTGQDIKDSIDALDVTAGSLGKDSSLQAINTTLQSILSALSPSVISETINMGSQTIAQYNRGVFTKDVSKTGYTPIGIVAIQLSNNWMYVGSFMLSGSTAQVVIHNINTNTDQTLQIGVLYVRN